MRTVSTFLLPCPITHSFDRSTTQKVRSSIATAARTQIPEYRSHKTPNNVTRVCSLTILVLLAVNCVLWTYPIADHLAEWAGVSLLNSIFVGFTAMLLAVPITTALIIHAWRRMTR